MRSVSLKSPWLAAFDDLDEIRRALLGHVSSPLQENAVRQHACKVVLRMLGDPAEGGEAWQRGYVEFVSAQLSDPFRLWERLLSTDRTPSHERTLHCLSNILALALNDMSAADQAHAEATRYLTTIEEVRSRYDSPFGVEDEVVAHLAAGQAERLRGNPSRAWMHFVTAWIRLTGNKLDSFDETVGDCLEKWAYEHVQADIYRQAYRALVVAILTKELASGQIRKLSDYYKQDDLANTKNCLLTISWLIQLAIDLLDRWPADYPVRVSKLKNDLLLLKTATCQDETSLVAHFWKAMTITDIRYVLSEPQSLRTVYQVFSYFFKEDISNPISLLCQIVRHAKFDDPEMVQILKSMKPTTIAYLVDVFNRGRVTVSLLSQFVASWLRSRSKDFEKGHLRPSATLGRNSCEWFGNLLYQVAGCLENNGPQLDDSVEKLAKEIERYMKANPFDAKALEAVASLLDVVKPLEAVGVNLETVRRVVREWPEVAPNSGLKELIERIRCF